MIEREYHEHSPEVRHEIRRRAYEIDPGAWESYSGKPKEEKRRMDRRRSLALGYATETWEEENPTFYD